MQVKKFAFLAILPVFCVACTPHGSQVNMYNGAAYTCTKIKGQIYGDRHRRINNSHLDAASRARLESDYTRYGCSQIDEGPPITW